MILYDDIVSIVYPLSMGKYSIVFKTNATLDGWWMMDTTVMFLVVGFISELCYHKPLAGFLPKDG